MSKKKSKQQQRLLLAVAMTSCHTDGGDRFWNHFYKMTLKMTVVVAVLKVDFEVAAAILEMRLQQ